MHKSYRRHKLSLRSLAAFLLAIIMITSLVPMAVFATGIGEEGQTNSEDYVDPNAAISSVDYEGTEKEPAGQTLQKMEAITTFGDEISPIEGEDFITEDETEEPEDPADDPEDPTEPEPITVTFMVNGVQYGETVVVGENGKIAAPEQPAIPAGMIAFRGWFPEDAADDAEPFDFEKDTVSENLTLIAKFSNTWLIKFKAAADGQVIDTKQVANGAAVTGTSVTVTPPANSRLMYWYVEEDYNGVDTAPQQFEFGTAASRDMTLVPWFSATYFVIYMSEGTQVPVGTVIYGERVTQPANPTRTGYTFRHWSTEPNGNTAFNFGTNYTEHEDLFLYAVWTPQNVNYTIVYWVEKPNFAGDPGEDPDNYVFNKSVTRTAQAGSTVDLKSGTGLDRITLSLGSGSSARTVDWATFSHGESKTILGNGTTIINVYFKRVLFTYTFELSPDASNNPTGTPSANNYSTIARRSATIAFNDGRTFGQGHNPADGSTYSPYSFQAKYEQDIENLWPSSWNATIQKTERTAQRTRVGITYQYSWRDPVVTDTFLEWSRPTSTITMTANPITKRFTITDDMVPRTGNTVTFTALYGTTRQVTVNYNLERLLSETGGTRWPNNNGAWYLKSDLHSQTLRLGNTGLGMKPIEGFEAGQDGTGTNNSSTTTFNFYYLRNRHTISFNTVGGTAKGNIPDVMFGEPLSYYNSTLNAHPTKTSDGETFVFDGWYLDADYNFPVTASTTMPNNNLTLFAKWRSTALTVEYFNDLTNSSRVHHLEMGRGYLPEEESPYYIGQVVDGKGTFDGWYVFIGTTTYTMRFSYDTPVNDNLQLHAVWKVDGYTVGYDIGEDADGTAPVDNNNYWLGRETRVANNSTFEAPEGKVFIGWVEENTGRFFYPGQILALSGNALFVAQYVTQEDFEENYVNLIFHANYINNTDATETWSVPKGEERAIAGAIFVDTANRNSMTGWSDNPGVNNNVDYALEALYTATAEKHFYAVWEFSGWTVTFEPGNNGSLDRNAVGISGDIVEFPGIDDGEPWGTSGVVEPAVIADSGWYFTGWDKLFPDTITSDLVFVAQYAPKIAIEVTAASDSKEYDGTPLTNSNSELTDGDLMEGHTYISATVTGSQTNVGSSANVASAAVIRDAAGNNVTDTYYIVDYVDGELEVTVNPAVIIITADDAEKVYDGTALTEAGYTTSALPQGVTSVEAVVEGTQTTVGTAANVVTGYTLWNGTADVTAYFAEAELVSGELEVTKRPLQITAGSDSKPYDGTALTYDFAEMTGDGTLAPSQTLVSVVVTGSAINPGDVVANVPSAAVIEDAAGNDVTDNYDIDYVDGELRITDANALSATITIVGGEKLYDGAPLIATITTDDPAGHTIVINDDVDLSINNVSESGEVTLIAGTDFTIIRNSDNADVTAYFVNNNLITVTPGTLTILQRSVILTSGSGVWAYNGTARSNTTTPRVTGDGFVSGEGVEEYSNFPTQTEVTPLTGVENSFDYTLNDNTIAGNYNIVKVYGTLIITRNLAPVVIYADSNSKVYDGTALTDDGFTTSALPQGVAEVTATVAGTQTNAGTGINRVTGYTLLDAEGNDVTANYPNVVTVPGALVVTRRLITITADSNEKPYDGTALTDDGSSVTYGSIVDGQTYTANVRGSQTYVGWSLNVVSGAVIRDASNRNVTSNYLITYAPGVLRVTPSEAVITITAASDSKTYDGTALENAGYAVLPQPLPAGVTEVRATVEGSVVNVNTGETDNNLVTGYTLWNGTRNVTAMFPAATLLPGTLTVTQREIVITANDDDKVYDGTSLTNDGYTVSGLLDGQTVTDVTVTGSQINVGNSPNVPSGGTVILGGGGDDQVATSSVVASTDLTGNYSISYVNGTLRVDPRPVTITAGSGTKVYGQADPAMWVRMTQEAPTGGLVNGDTIDYVLERLSGENVGSYTTSVTVVGTYPNYTITLVDGVFEITQAPLWLFAPDVSIVLGTAFPSQAVLVGGITMGSGQEVYFGEQLPLSVFFNDYTLAVGEYQGAVRITPFENPNYEILFYAGTLTITAPPPGVDIPDGPIVTVFTPPDDDTTIVLTPPGDTPDDAPAPIMTVPEEAPPLAAPVEITDEPIPLAPMIGETQSWHLWNLIFAIASVILAIMMGIRAFAKKKDEDEDEQLEADRIDTEEQAKERKKSLIFGLAIPIAAIISVVIFFLTQDMRNPMALVDSWTIAHAALFLADLVCFLIVERKVKKDDDEQQGPARA